MDADDVEKLREMEGTREENKLQVVMANFADIESLRIAFEGCRGVFHTSAFTDPAGLSGYTVILSLPLLFFVIYCYVSMFLAWGGKTRKSHTLFCSYYTHVYLAKFIKL